MPSGRRRDYRGKIQHPICPCQFSRTLGMTSISLIGWVAKTTHGRQKEACFSLIEVCGDSALRKYKLPKAETAGVWAVSVDPVFRTEELPERKALIIDRASWSSYYEMDHSVNEDGVYSG
ncbi:hypothetical protein QAD02_020182 [Eretmocerus hayati]|uniref:Uncharacterized protein n=1 Tax=Eretmocerus hayati TaxID=131215 RepID=A0ACC2PRH5_9HYME|nr:hypothetical protein QAD02_020182 [Eretmocerus hayati]